MDFASRVDILEDDPQRGRKYASRDDHDRSFDLNN
jgi:hypothetical protein